MAYTSRDMRRFNHLLQETDAVYHEMAQHWGLSDSVMGVLYTLCDAGAGAACGTSAIGAA